MKIIGISPDVWISSAALIEDGKIIAASPEERFNRQKMSKVFPLQAIDYCLNVAGITMDAVDYVAMSWNPGAHIQSASLRYSDSTRWRGEYLYSVPSYLLTKFHVPEVECMEEKLYVNGKTLSIMFVSHHNAHAANAFLLSPFEEAAILTIDGRGERETCMFAKGKRHNIRKLKSINMPYSLGLFYGAITQYLGFKPDSDEWKVMALASYGTRNNGYYKKLKSLIRLKKDGTFELDMSYFTYHLFDKHPAMYSGKLIQLLGSSRTKDAEVQDKHIEIATAIQQIFEESVTYLLNHLYQETKCKNIVLSGGCAMNSVFNGKLRAAAPFENVFISSCPDDSGVSVGAALYVYNCILDYPHREIQVHNYWGPEFSDEEIRETLEKYKVTYRVEGNIAKVVAQLLSDGQLIGWFQGKMEFGQRALGNRSILADPRSEKTKDIVNKAVKYRESFRPFAPAILEEDVHEYFEMPLGITVPFMEKVYPIKKEKRQSIPAVVHIDGSGRLQTVSQSVSPLFYDLINEFKNITNIPVILNTSFNLNGEPIVCSPTDAIRTFFSCGLDHLAMGHYLISKRQ